MQANAITLAGNGNRLELHDGFSFTGNVVAGGGSNNVLALGDSDNSTFDTSQIGIVQQFRGFSGFEKTGASAWTLTGATGEVTPWTLIDGTLSVSADDQLGDVSGGLTFDGGTLQNTAAFATARNFTLDAGGGTFQTDADPAVNGIISGVGSLSKTGAGTLTLAADNEVGLFAAHDGTLSVDGGELN